MAAPDSDPRLGAALDDLAWLRRLARSLVRDPHLAEDAVQHVLVAAHKRGGATVPGRGWLASVLRNFLRQTRRETERRRAREACVAERESAPAADETASRLELQARVLDAVRSLDEPYRTAIVLRYFDHLPPREIARRTRTPVKTVHTRIDRALAKLRGKLDASFGGERSAWMAALLPFADASRFLPWISRPAAPSGGALLSVPLKLTIAGAALVIAAIGGQRFLSQEARRPVPSVVATPAPESEPISQPDRRALRTPEDDTRVEIARTTEQEDPTGIASTVPARIDLGPPAPETLDREFWGRVLDAETRSPLAGARILVDWGSRASGLGTGNLEQPDVVTDVDGSFVLPYASWLRSHVEIRLDGFNPAFVELREELQDPGFPMEVLLARTATLEARVEGVLAQELALVLRIDPNELSEPRGAAVRRREILWKVGCDVDGVARFAGIPSGVDVHVEIRDGDALLWRVPEPLVLRSGELHRVTWSPAVGTNVFGVVTDASGAPVPDQELWLLAADPRDTERSEQFLFEWKQRGTSARTALTDAFGGYALDAVPPGSWWLGPAFGSSSYAPLARLLVLDGTEGGIRVDLELREALYIRGTLVAPAWAPPSSSSIYAFPLQGSGRAFARPDGIGSFELGPLAEGSYRVFTIMPGILDADSGTARAGDHDVRIELGGPGSILGRVADEEARAVDARLALFLPTGGSMSIGSSVGDVGRFCFSGLEPGTYAVRAETSDGRVGLSGTVVLPPGSAVEDVIVRVAPAGLLRVSITGSRDAVRCRVSVAGQICADETVRAEAATNISVPPGEVLIEIRREGETLEEKRVFVAPSESLDVEFLLGG